MTSLFNFKRIKVQLVRKTSSLNIEILEANSLEDTFLAVEELLDITNWAASFIEINSIYIEGTRHFTLKNNKSSSTSTDCILRLFSGLQELIYSFLYLPQTIIINYKNGASNIGIELGIGADIKISQESASFDFDFLKVGITPGCGLLGVLCTQINPSSIKSWILSSKKVTAKELYEQSFLTHLKSSRDDHQEILEEIHLQSPTARIQTKRSFLSHILPHLDNIKESEKSYNRSSLLSGDYIKYLLNKDDYQFIKAKEFSKLIKTETTA